MMGVQAASAQLFYDFCLDDHIPSDHLLRSIDGHLDLEGLRQTLKPFYSQIGRPSIDPELMIRMLIVGYCMGIRSERRLCEEVHLNLAYRWFCRLGLDGKVPDHSTFSKNRHGRFRESDLLRHMFETIFRPAEWAKSWVERPLAVRSKRNRCAVVTASGDCRRAQTRCGRRQCANCGHWATVY
jgi:transposase